MSDPSLPTRTDTPRLAGLPGEKPLLQVLADGDVLIADGAAGTMLMAAGLPAGTPPELWNVERPQAILDLHGAYVSAGSRLILTNTFGGTRVKLGRAGMGARVGEFNRAGVQLARQAAAGQAYVAGDIGPTGELMAPFGPLTPAAATEAFAEQAAALDAAGVDAIWIETMTDLEEVKAAIAGTRQVTTLPIFCSLSFGPKGRTMMGVSAKTAAQELWPLGLSDIGANCGEGLAAVAGVLKAYRDALGPAPLIAKPNAGLPKMVAGETIYDTDLAEFAEHIADFVSLVARIVGACCGSGPAYIQAIARRLA